MTQAQDEDQRDQERRADGGVVSGIQVNNNKSAVKLPKIYLFNLIQW